jgi:hypothetical protein
MPSNEQPTVLICTGQFAVVVIWSGYAAVLELSAMVGDTAL